MSKTRPAYKKKKDFYHRSIPKSLLIIQQIQQIYHYLHKSQSRIIRNMNTKNTYSPVIKINDDSYWYIELEKHCDGQKFVRKN